MISLYSLTPQSNVPIYLHRPKPQSADIAMKLRGGVFCTDDSEAIEDGGNLRCLAVDGNYKQLGYLEATVGRPLKDNSTEAYIEMIYVPRQYRKQGVGTHLVTILPRYAAEKASKMSQRAILPSHICMRGELAEGVTGFWQKLGFDVVFEQVVIGIKTLTQEVAYKGNCLPFRKSPTLLPSSQGNRFNIGLERILSRFKWKPHELSIWHPHYAQYHQYAH